MTSYPRPARSALAAARPARQALAATGPARQALAATGPARQALAATGPARWALVGVSLACATTLLAGCGRLGASAVPGKTITVTATPAGTAQASGAASTPAPAVSSAAACPTRYLGAKLGPSQGAAGSTYTVIDFTNLSNVTCTLYGYPGVSLAGGSPITQIGLAATENPSPPRGLVTLAPGAMASALLRIVQAADFPPARCHQVQASYLQIYPPNQTTPIYLAYSAPACAGRVRLLTVSVVRPGTGG
jgi:hypothetical protein